MPSLRLVPATERLSFLGGQQPADATFLSGVAKVSESFFEQPFAISYAASVFSQLTALGLCIAAITSRNNSPVIELVLIMETVVSGVEASWYIAVGVWYTCGNGNGRSLSAAPVEWRYIDWVLTTPTMLVSLVFVFRWRADGECTQLSELVDGTEEWVILITIVCFDWLMLAVGYVYEARENGTRNYASTWVERLKPVGGKLLGWFFFIGAFVPVLVALMLSYTVEGGVAFTVTFSIWALYGVVAFAVRETSRKNTLYNILDIFSKNVVAIGIAVWVLTNEETVCD